MAALDARGNGDSFYLFWQAILAMGFSAWVVRCALMAVAAAWVRDASALERVVDDFSDASRWEVTTSDGVTLECRTEKSDNPNDPHDTVLRLDYDFRSSGYAGVRLKLPLGLAPNFELAFAVRGDLPPNNLEFKLVDPGGENVWWVNRRAYEFPRDWSKVAMRRRHFSHAWGPSRELLTEAGAIEIVVASAEGGRGTVWLDDLTYRELPETKPYAGKPTVSATSIGLPSSASFVVDGDLDTMWRSKADAKEAGVTIDFGQPREFGGMAIYWDPHQGGPAFELQFSDDGQTWRTIESSETHDAEELLSLPESETRYVRISLETIFDGCCGIREIEFLPLDVSRDANSFELERARRAPRGTYPRAIGGEGTFWTIVGAANDEHEALVSEDGSVEVDKQAWSIEPFISTVDQSLNWANATDISQSLAEGFAPVPTVTREHDQLRLSVTAAADGSVGRSSLIVLYTLTNKLDEPINGMMKFLARPYQVNPPYQWLNSSGGVSQVEAIEFDEDGRTANVDRRRISLSEPPDWFGNAIIRPDGNVEILSRQKFNDAKKAAVAGWGYEFELAPKESHSWAICVPFSQRAVVRRELLAPFEAARDRVAYVRERQAAVVAKWREATDTFELLVPPEAEDVVNTIRSTLAYILINQDGFAIHPGSRSYERSWIRDGALTSAALCRFGMADEAKAFVDWYGPFQFESGKVPCVVDRRGADPVPENDSHGEYVMAVMNVYRFTGDKEFLQRHWPRVQKAVAYIERLRGERMTAEYADASTKAVKQEQDKPPVSLHAFYGLMPESISHEGYAAKPMHSYWDDFFTLRGLKDAADMARVVGDGAKGDEYQRLADDFGRTLAASIELATKTHGIDYIPGCVEFGDFDATSTTVALWPGGAQNVLPAELLKNTFNKYWERFVERRDNPAFEWIDYTPYELRVVGSFVLLGQPERAWEALDFFMRDRRPPGWNQWPEVIHREPRAAKFIGDLPHTWCGSDFVNSVRMMFLYERDEDRALVLMAGVPEEWLSQEPVGFRNMPTYGGRVTCTLAQRAGEAGKLQAHLEGTCPIPAGNLRLSAPGGRAASATVNGKVAEIDDAGRVVIGALPAEVEITVVSGVPR